FADFRWHRPRQGALGLYQHSTQDPGLKAIPYSLSGKGLPRRGNPDCSELEKEVVMDTVYKIHPAIGIARVGNSPAQFFLGPELPGGARVELVNGTEQPLQQFKDATGRIKRQAARFRVFAYDKDPATGALSSPREVTNSSTATIVWTVQLANRKAAGVKFPWPG